MKTFWAHLFIHKGKYKPSSKPLQTSLRIQSKNEGLELIPEGSFWKNEGLELIPKGAFWKSKGLELIAKGDFWKNGGLELIPEAVD